ncbi:DUF3347 domain-containing protein [Arenibacter lacus]|uniref:DUF3347 domain-containing protein n=1 Tax=Arenibacter lacus TaxID=2608629 RepID=UPI00123E176B|nr:DUF3347 domain-containing protein [Arenibacter lacus]
MNTVKLKIGVLALGLLSMGMMSCKETKKNTDQNATNAQAQEVASEQEATGVALIINDYMKLKDALVGDNQELAAKAGETLAGTLSTMEANTLADSKEAELQAIIDAAKESAHQIVKSTITQQREHFEGLSDNLVSLVAIAGTPMPLYQQFCPMYKDDKGGMWVSTEKAVLNPYFGSQMLKCGFVQKELN